MVLWNEVCNLPGPLLLIHSLEFFQEESVAELDDMSDGECSSEGETHRSATAGLRVIPSKENHEHLRGRSPGSGLSPRSNPLQSDVTPQSVMKSPCSCGVRPDDDHSPQSLPCFPSVSEHMWTSTHAANCPSEDRSSSLVNVLLQPLPPNYDSETQLPPLELDYASLVRLSLWSVIDGHGGGCVATYASEVLLPHIAASISRVLGCAIVERGVFIVNGELRDANALDLDGLIRATDQSPSHSNPNSVHYRSPYERNYSEDEEGARNQREVTDSDVVTQSSHDSRHSVIDAQGSIASSLIPRSEPAASASSVKTSVKTAASPAARESPVGTHSPSEVAAITHAITSSFLAVDEGWINSIDPVATHQTSCQSNGRWNAGACALVVMTLQRLEWGVVEPETEQGLQGPEAERGQDTSHNRDAARRRMLDYVARAKSVSSLSTTSSTSSLTTDDRAHASGLESEITETEDDDRSAVAETRKRKSVTRMSHASPKESLISAPGGCSCHFYRAHDAYLYTAHVGDCRACLLGSAPPRTIKVPPSSSDGPSSTDHQDTTDDESSHHSSDETECLSSSDHDAGSSDDEEVEAQGNLSTVPYSMAYTRRRRHSRKRPRDDFAVPSPFIAPPLRSDPAPDFRVHDSGRFVSHGDGSQSSDCSTTSSRESYNHSPIINLPPATRPIDLTTDHSAYNPAEVTAVLRRCNNAPRAISAGVGGGIKRVAGSLAVTRALGDAYLKTPKLSFFPYKSHAPYITARPEVNCRPLVKGGDKVLILATDGIWERTSGDDVLRWVRNFYAERTAKAERRAVSRQAKQPDRTCVNDSTLKTVTPSIEEKDEDEQLVVSTDGTREITLNPQSPCKKRKINTRHNRRVSTRSTTTSTIADVVVRRVLNKVRRARNISSLSALMSLPKGRARRSKHDDITVSVIDLSAFVS
jgi:serine/threonine protein phosphatase PrpC